MHQPTQRRNSAPYDAAHIDDAMLNGGSPGDTQRAALQPADLEETHPVGADVRGDNLLDSKASTLRPGGLIIYWKSALTSGRRLAATVMDGLRNRTGGRDMKRKETHMNRGTGTLWCYWPAIVVVTSLALGMLAYIMSNSGMGTNISLMFQ